MPVVAKWLSPRKFTAAVGRFDRSRGRSIESIGSVGSVFLRIFRFFRQVGELEICPVSKFQVCTTLGGRKNAEKPKREFSEFFGSVGSVFRSVRSILRPRVVVDRSVLISEKKWFDILYLQIHASFFCRRKKLVCRREFFHVDSIFFSLI